MRVGFTTESVARLKVVVESDCQLKPFQCFDETLYLRALFFFGQDEDVRAPCKLSVSQQRGEFTTTTL